MLAGYGRRLATGASAVLLGGSLEYAASGGRPARCEPAKEPEPEVEDREEGLERYLGYTASLARLKLVMLKAKGAIATGAKLTAAKGAAATGAKGAAAKAALADGARYVAYSSDVGESMRPVLKPWMVNATYGIAGAYVLYDAGCDVQKKQIAGHPTEVLVATGAYKLVFHGVVSLGLPFVIIHSAVHQAHNLFSKEVFASMPRVVKWGPSAIGLGLIPLMPLLDPPAEHVLETVFDAVWPVWRVGEPRHHDHLLGSEKDD